MTKKSKRTLFSQGTYPTGFYEVSLIYFG